MSINFCQNICNELEKRTTFIFSHPPHDKNNKMTFSPREDSDQRVLNGTTDFKLRTKTPLLMAAKQSALFAFCNARRLTK